MELDRIFITAKEISRFTGSDLPEGVVVDNVYDHTKRCVEIAEALPLDELRREKLMRMLYIHDLPEVENLRRMGRNSDLTAPEKELDRKLALEVSEQEITIAGQILSDSDMSLYQEFEIASNYLSNKTDWFDGPAVALIAKVIDSYDATLVLHRHLADWYLSTDCRPKLIDPDRSLSFAIRIDQTYREKLADLESSEEITICRYLLDDMFHQIRDFWFLVVDNGVDVPRVIERGYLT